MDDSCGNFNMKNSRQTLCLIHRLSYTLENLAYSGRNRATLLRIFFFPYENNVVRWHLSMRGGLQPVPREYYSICYRVRGRPHRP